MHSWETLTMVHQILKCMDVLMCMKGGQNTLLYTKETDWTLESQSTK